MGLHATLTSGSVLGVALSGNVCAIASSIDSAGNPAVAVWIYERNSDSGLWTQTQLLVTPAAASGAVALGKLGTVLVLSSSAGTVRIYERSGSGSNTALL